MNFTLDIISPEGVIFHDVVSEVLVPTAKGQIGILPHHAHLYSKLVEGEVHIMTGGKQKTVAVLGGFIEVGDQTVTIISDYAILAENIQVAHALEAKKRAQELMAEKKSEVDFALADRDLKRSILELKVAEKLKKKPVNI